MTLSMLAEISRRAGERELKMADEKVNFLPHDFARIFVLFFFLQDEGRMGEVVHVQTFFA